MKKYRLLIILLATSYSIFSQGLKPVVQKIGTDTVFSFTTSQTKAIAKLITKGMYCDSVAGRLEKENLHLYQVIAINDSVMVAVNSRLKVIDSLNSHQGRLIEYQRDQLEVTEKNFKRVRRHKIALGSILTVVLILVVL